jgi:hypothetical protein
MNYNIIVEPEAIQDLIYILKNTFQMTVLQELIVLYLK